MISPLAYDDDALSAEAFADSESSFGSIRSDHEPMSEMHLFAEKLAVPSTEGMVNRPRLNDLLAKSVGHFNGTLLSGRARTGKTMAAADLARGYDRVAWYSVESTDIDWALFSRYFQAAVENAQGTRSQPIAPATGSQIAISSFLGDLLGPGINESGSPMLIVVDDIHHVFDAPWFSDLFNLLLFSVLPNSHLLFTCRSKPSLPLWRLRSKQLLNVIDEKVLAFDQTETAQFVKANGYPVSSAKTAHKQSFGRIGKIVDHLNRNAAA